MHGPMNVKMHTPLTKMNTWESSTKTYELRYEKFQLKLVQRNATPIWQSQVSPNKKYSDVTGDEFN